jgi:hypothetical protein
VHQSAQPVTTTRALFAAIAVVVLTAAAPAIVSRRAAVPRAPALPERLTDAAFWRLTEQFSEPAGTFHSENYISNENAFQTVIPELVARVTPGGVYLGVGPEQNFTYIAAVRPRLAFIVDIRRGNLLEHLFYKALFELSPDRAAFLSRLFGRPRPTGIGPGSSVQQLFDAFDTSSSSDALFRESLTAIVDRLTKTHRFPLSAEDLRRLEVIYRTAFFTDGPNLMYRRTDGVNAGRRPTYAELMTSTDGRGRSRSYLADETTFRFVKDLETRNLVVPIVGDFGGPKALRAVGAYVRQHDAVVSAFYLSNVEMYLQPDGKRRAFCASVASMPLDAASTFIRSQSTGSAFTSALGQIQAETRECAER